MCPNGHLLQFCIIRTCVIQNIKISALQIPKYVSYANLRLETGLTSLEVRVWMTILNYWFNLSLFPLCFTQLTVSDDFLSTWKQTMTTKISSLDFSPGFLFSMQYNQGKALIKQHVADTNHQLDLARSLTFIACESNRYSVSPMTYLTNLEVPKHWKAFILAQCHVLPQLSLKVDTGRFLN